MTTLDIVIPAVTVGFAGLSYAYAMWERKRLHKTQAAEAEDAATDQANVAKDPRFAFPLSNVIFKAPNSDRASGGFFILAKDLSKGGVQFDPSAVQIYKRSTEQP